MTGAGVRTRCWTTRVVRRGVRMYGRDDVELALYALEEGMGARGAAELVFDSLELTGLSTEEFRL